MQRWLKRVLPDRGALEKHWCLKYFTDTLRERGCFNFHRHSVIPSFALGLFIAFIPPTPFLPIHLLTCTVLGLYLRLNLPVLITTVFVSNPFTWVPQVVGSLWVGAKLLHIDLMPLVRAMSRETFWNDIGELWAPLFLGAVVLGLIAATSGYIAATLVWRARVAYQLKQRRARLVARPTAFN